MREFKNGTLRSSDGKKVTSRKQALAIAMSESEDYAEKADLISAIHIGSIREAEEILKAAGTEGDLFEKARKVGDMHPNGKWVWRQSANGGKGDWRVANPKRGGGARKTAAPAAKTDDTPSNSNQKTDGKSVSQKTISDMTNAEKEKVTPTNNPKLYIELGKKSEEKKKLIDLLKKVGVAKEEEETDSGIYGLYRVGNEYIKIIGTEVHTGLKAVKQNAKYLGMSGHKRWYGGGTNIEKTDKTEKFSVFNDVKMKTLTDRLNKKKSATKKEDGSKPYIYNDGGMVGGETQIKDEDGLLKVLNGAKSNTVLIYDKNWKGLNSEAKKIGEKNGWKVEVDVDKEGNPSSTGSYIIFKKKTK